MYSENVCKLITLCVYCFVIWKRITTAPVCCHLILDNGHFWRALFILPEDIKLLVIALNSLGGNFICTVMVTIALCGQIHVGVEVLFGIWFKQTIFLVMNSIWNSIHLWILRIFCVWWGMTNIVLKQRTDKICKLILWKVVRWYWKGKILSFIFYHN